MLAYLDWNIYNKIEQLGKNVLTPQDELLYSEIYELVKTGKIHVPYSNAHINDLLRGSQKSMDFIPGHLQILKAVTNNLCIAQYWDKEKVTWHYRDPEEFFNTAYEDMDWDGKTFDDLMKMIEAPLEYLEGAQRALVQIQLTTFRIAINTPLGDIFKPLYKQDPIFSKMFPVTKENPTMKSLFDDIRMLNVLFKKDFAIYKGLKAYLNRMRITLKNQKPFLDAVDELNQGIPKHLVFDEVWSKAWDDGVDKQKLNKNPHFQAITNKYYKINFQGHNSDERFANMVDDSLHVFYGAHCDYFVTIDNKCHYKADETYKQIKLGTKAMKPDDFLVEIKTKLKIQ